MLTEEGTSFFWEFQLTEGNHPLKMTPLQKGLLETALSSQTIFVDAETNPTRVDLPMK